ncbi:MAG: mechanosensitive ion channel [Clostridia bacterium]|nr:mechanosensitive ion channel [Clostridia bacterium]
MYLLETATSIIPEEITNISSFSKWLNELPLKIYNAIPDIIGAVAIIIAGFFFSKICGKLLVRIMKKRNVDESVHHFLKSMLVVSMRIVFVLFALSVLGFDISSFAAALGAAGITAGLGLQSLISQFASGIEIMFNKPFKSGDYIALENVEGTVEEIHFMNTTLLTPDNKRVVIPNSHITTNNLINYTAQTKRRVNLHFSISYKDDIALAKKVIEDAIAASPHTLDDPNTVVAVGAHSESSITIDALVWCKSNNYWPTFYDMQERVKLDFDKAGINIPFNQLDVHITQS